MPTRFGLIGEYQSGKSLFINCLLQRSVATVGGGSATTHTVVNYQYGETEYVKLLTTDHKSSILPINELQRLDTATNILVVDVYLRNEFLKNFILTDMPGFGANDSDNEIASSVLPKIDFAILIAYSDKSFGDQTNSFKSLRALKEYRIPYFFVLNCTKTDRWRCDDEGNLEIAKQDLNMLSFYPPQTYPLQDNGINIVNLMWYWYSICDEDDELINRKANRLSFNEYGIEPSIKKELREVSNFFLIKRLFDVEHRGYFELRRYFKEEINALRRELCPIGTIQAFATNSIPDGWMICDGRALDTNEYHDLYYAIGTMYGKKDDTHFMIPDLQGRFIRGWDREGNTDAKRVLGSSQNDALQGHSHSVESCSENGRHFHYIGYKHYPTQEANIGYSTYQHEHVIDHGSSEKKGNRNTDYDGSHKHEIVIGAPKDYSSYGTVRMDTETRPINVALLFCIKVYDVSYTSLLNITRIKTSNMKSPGEGVYEKFDIIDGPFVIQSDLSDIKYPIRLEFHDSNDDILYQRLNHDTPINLPKNGNYFIRFSTSKCKDKSFEEDLLEIYHIDSIGICGDFSNWGHSLNLTQRGSTLIFEGEFEFPKGKYEYKIRANNSWDVELGGDPKDLSSWLGDNLILESNGEKISLVLDLSSHPWDIFRSDSLDQLVKEIQDSIG